MLLPPKSYRHDIVHRIAWIFTNEWKIFEPEFDSYEQGYNRLMGE